MPVDRSTHGSGAPGNRFRARARLPPWSVTVPARSSATTTMAIPLTFLALLLERLFGYPDRVLAAIGHPVIWIGRLIETLDERWNRRVRSSQERRALGVAALV